MMGLYVTTATTLAREVNRVTLQFAQALPQYNYRHCVSFHHTHTNCQLLSCGKFFTLLVIVLLSTPQTVRALSADITVNDYGVNPIKPGDTAMVFYANVSHTGRDASSLIAARLRMEKCCFQIPSSNSTNCDSMKLISGLGIVFHSMETRVLNMYFVNYDLYDREGSCILRLLTRPSKADLSSAQEQAWETGQDLKIPFKTVLPKPGLLKKLFISLGGSSNGYRICNTDNYNALHECSNYDDCLIRYSGGKSLFSKESKECETTPECENSATNFLSIVTRKCEKSHDIDNIRKSFTPDMKRVQPENPSNAISTSSGKPHHFSFEINKINRTKTRPIVNNLVCEHGVHTIGKNGQPNCTCHSGWRSLTLEEWVKKGGITNLPGESMPYHHMCTVPLIDARTRGYLLLAFVLIFVTIPFIAFIIINCTKSDQHGKMRTKRTKRSTKKATPLHEEVSSTSSSSEEDNSDEENKDDEKGKLISKKNTRNQIDEMEEEEADKVISEITNRREPTLSRKTFRNDNDDNPPPAFSPPLSSLPTSPTGTPLVQSKASQISQTKLDKASNVPSDPNVSMLGTSEGFLSQTTVPGPPTATPSTLTKPPPSPKSSGRKISAFAPSSDFDFGRKAEDNEGNIKAWVATQATSMDDLLTLNNQEKWRAHVPMSPKKTSEEKGVSVVVANCATVELRNNNIILHSMSSEEITQRKKEEWAEFIRCVSEEKFTPEIKPGHCSISMERRQLFNNTNMYDDDFDEDDEDVAEYNRMRENMFPDFKYFHNDHKPTAVKVRSVPGMMQYHPFSSSESHDSPTFTRKDETEGLPQPPAHFIQKAFAAMPSEDLASRQECYRILSSLSSERFSSQEGGIKGTHSIWSNIASENTKEPSTTPATTMAGSRVVTSCEDGVGDEDNNITIRTRTIYGDMGSDVDSDGALEQMAARSYPSKPSHITETKGEMATEPCLEENSNRTVYGTSPVTTRPTTPTNQPTNQDSHERNRSFIDQLCLESDRIPSDTYDDSAASSRIASRSVSGTEFWKMVASHSIGGCGGNSLKRNERAELNSEATNAYKIKSSLESSLKAGRSRSGTNLF